MAKGLAICTGNAAYTQHATEWQKISREREGVKKKKLSLADINKRQTFVFITHLFGGKEQETFHFAQGVARGGQWRGVVVDSSYFNAHFVGNSKLGNVCQCK